MPNLMLEYDQWRRQQSLNSKKKNANKRFHFFQWDCVPSAGDGGLRGERGRGAGQDR